MEDWFANLLPDSTQVREQIARRFGVANRPFALLKEIGRDCIGAVQLLQEGQAPDDLHSIQCDPLTEAQVEEELRRVAHPSYPWSVNDTPFRISLAGAQEKTALLHHDGQWCRPLGSTPTTHILKLPIDHAAGVPMPHSLENEWLCSRLLSAWGIPVAPSEVLRFREWSCLAVERFDRRLSPDGRWWMRLPQEDLCQALGHPSERKYESDGGPGLSEVGQLLRNSAGKEDHWTFLRTQVLFWLLQAPDGHAKNFSVHLQAGGIFRLTPLYDVLSAYPITGKGRGKLPTQQLKMAMAVSGKNRHYAWSEILPRHWMATARSQGLGGEMEAWLQQLPNQADDVIQRVAAELPPDFPDDLFRIITGGMAKAATRFARS